MLPDKLLSYTRMGEGSLVPTWLTPADETWLRVFLEELRSLEGLSMGEIEDRMRDKILPDARRNGARSRAAEGVWEVEKRLLKKTSAAKVDPPRIRRVLFPLAATMDREAALAAATTELDISTESIEAWLFADRPRARRLGAGEPRSAADVIERYNLTLAQSFMVRATRLTATIREHSRFVVAAAKARGLMVSFFEPDDAPDRSVGAGDSTELVRDHGEGGISLDISGSLALFHETTKYGRLIAGLLPVIAVTAGWTLHARVRVAGESLALMLDPSAPLPRTRALPAEYDSGVERRLARELRRLGSEWSLRREDAVVRVGRRLFFPDFCLVGPRGDVLVEVVGYWTDAYLRGKLEALRHVKVPMVICVDERHADVGFRSLPGVLTYRKHVDASEVLREAERQLGRSGPGYIASSRALRDG